MLGLFACFSLPNRVQFRRPHIAFILLIALCGVSLVLYFSANSIFDIFMLEHVKFADFKRTQRVKYAKRVGNYTSACRLPSLDPFHPSVLGYVKDLGKLRCTGQTYSTFINNVLEVKGEGISSVQYRIIERPRGDDFKAVLSEPKNLPNMAENVTPGIQEDSKTSKKIILFIYLLYHTFSGYDPISNISGLKQTHLVISGNNLLVSEIFVKWLKITII